MTVKALHKNRAIRQEALREQLTQQGHVQHVVDILGKLSDEKVKVSDEMLDRYKVVLPNKLKLISKYIPDLKAVEIEGNLSNDSHENWLNRLDDK